MSGNLRVVVRWAAVAATAISISLRVVYVRQVIAQPIGRYSGPQILEKAQHLCGLVDPRASHAVYSVGHNTGHTMEHMWEADCAEPGGDDFVHLAWDADTGDLCVVGHLQSASCAARPAAPLDRVEAICAATRWMRDLGVARQSRGWRIERTKCLGSLWSFRWRSHDAVAYVALSSGGDLRELLFRRDRYSARLSGTPRESIPLEVDDWMVEG